MKRIALVLSLLFTLLLPPQIVGAQGASCSTSTQYPNGAVMTLANTTHLWVLDAGALRWAGDTRALANQTVRWDQTCTMTVDFLMQARRGTPLLSAGLVKIGDPIFLAKWETNQRTPTLLHIQSLADVDAFGITADNYSRFVIDRTQWERQYGFNVDTLTHAELASVLPPGATLAVAPLVRRGVPVNNAMGPVANRYPALVAPPDDALHPCLVENPSCTRDPWWVEWNELQRDDPLEFAFAPGLSAEYRFAEAIWLLQQWPDGRMLIADAAGLGIQIRAVSAQRLPNAFAAFVPQRQLILFNQKYVESSTWMVADVLAHELRHASDASRNLNNARTPDDCVVREQRAYQTEADFMRWLTDRMGGLPARADVSKELSATDQQLYRNITAISRSPDPAAQASADYADTCAP